MKSLVVIALLLSGTLPAQAAEPGNASENMLGLDKSQIDDATKSMEEAARNLTNILGLILRSIPQFEAPVILKNGDILIRRVHKNNPPLDGSPFDNSPSDVLPTDGSKT